MTIAWMIFGALVSLVIVCGAEVATSAARMLDKPTRGIWGVAFAAIFLLVGSAPFREQSAGISLASLPRALPAASSAASVRVMPGVATRVTAEVSTSLRAMLHTVTRLIPASVDRYLPLAWLIVSAALLVLLVAVYSRIRVARRRWPVAELQGLRVRVSDDSGPAVVGLRSPEVVVPRWLFSRDAAQQRMVLAHEQEHVRAGDHLTLAAGCVAVAIMPWNPAAWWVLSRLRLAIELDCDARVLRQGAEPQSYGSLLIDLAEYTSGFRMGAPALADGTSHLQTRVMAMKKRSYRFARTRGALVGLAAVSLFLVACEAKLPTSAEINEMDVASAEKSMTMAALNTANASYLIDGAPATSEQAHALRPDQILGITVSTPGSGSVAKIINIRTVNGPRRVALTDTAAASQRGKAATSLASDLVGSAEPAAGTTVRVRGPGLSAFKGLLVVDGTIVDPSTFKKMDPKDIASIDVLKGPAAVAVYKDPRALNGVIDIKTKKGSE